MGTEMYRMRAVQFSTKDGTQQDIEDWRQEQTKECHTQHAGEYGDTDRMAHFSTRTF